jgi:lipopolysaccharide export system ATP-binding protein
MQEIIYGNFNYEVVYAIKRVITLEETKPLYVYGPAGAGKSFLMDKMSKTYPGKSQILESSDIKKSKTTKWRGCDLLILEDINTISSRTSPSKKLSELLNYFVKDKKQIVFTGTCAPSRLKLPKKVISEIKKGVVVSIKKFDMPSRRKALSVLGKDLSPEIINRLMGDNIKTIGQAIKAVEKVRDLVYILKEEKEVQETVKILESAGVTDELLSPVQEVAENLPEEFEGADDELSSLTQELSERFLEEMDRYEEEKTIRDKYRAKIYIWEMEGFNTNRIKKIIEEPIDPIIGEFFLTCEFASFTSEVEQLLYLQERYHLLDDKKLLDNSLINKEEIEEIEKALFDPDRVEWVEARIDELEMKQEGKEVKVYDRKTTKEPKKLVGEEEKPIEMKIESRNLVKIYNRKRVVDEVNLELRRSEIVGLLGPNGAGKSTTFYMITGFIRPESGAIYLNEEDITNKPMHERAKLGIGYLPQEASIFRGLSVEDNLVTILEVLVKDPKEREERFNELVEEFKLSPLLERNANKLSGGERRRVEIARALTSKPNFLLLDEPFTGIDPITREELQEMVLALKEKNIGILITDHNVRETLEITDRAYLMFDGKIILKGKADDLISNKKAKELYLGSKFKL